MNFFEMQAVNEINDLNPSELFISMCTKAITYAKQGKFLGELIAYDSKHGEMILNLKRFEKLFETYTEVELSSFILSIDFSEIKDCSELCNISYVLRDSLVGNVYTCFPHESPLYKELNKIRPELLGDLIEFVTMFVYLTVDVSKEYYETLKEYKELQEYLAEFNPKFTTDGICSLIESLKDLETLERVSHSIHIGEKITSFMEELLKHVKTLRRKECAFLKMRDFTA